MEKKLTKKKSLKIVKGKIQQIQNENGTKIIIDYHREEGVFVQKRVLICVQYKKKHLNKEGINTRNIAKK